MLKKNSKRYLIISLVLIEVISLFLTMKSFSNKEIEEKKETYEVDKKHFSMFINDGKGNYEEYNNNVFPNGYAINLDKSRCIDTKGNVINGILSKNGSNVTITSNKTAYCYLYFDEGTAVDTILANGGNDLWKSTLEDDGYRYVGTNPDNYICFGTTDKNECISDTDKYMYRIIGIFEDEEGKQHLKLIKKEALNTTYAWNADYESDVNWENSDLYKGINGNYFLNNTAYSYMQNSNWLNKIETWNYIATNTWAWGSGMDYEYGETIQNIYLHEMNRNGKTSNAGEWETVSGKISLMYVSDYLLSLGSSAIEYIPMDNEETLKTGWMYISNNDSGAPSRHEWTMTRAGEDVDDYYSYYVNSNGFVGYTVVWEGFSVRPVFFLTTETQIENGTGSSSDPYIINNPTDTEKLIENVSSDMLWDSTLEDDGYRYVGTDPDNYICFGTTDKNECISDTDKYMYRIIGIFEDEEGKQHLKLIKKEALNTSYKWNADYSNDVNWENSDLYKGLNDDYFLNNPTYSYMQNSRWLNKIETWDYTATNTLTKENSGPDYYNSVTVQNVYLHEMNRSSKTSSIGKWETVSGKISLMYVSDYLLSLGSSVLEYTTNEFKDTLKTGWMHIANDDSGAPSASEWTSTRYGERSSIYFAWAVTSVGNVNLYAVYYTSSVRPVFYLTEDIQIKSGTGKNNDPYIIYQEPTVGEKLLSNPTEGLDKTTSYSGLYRYVGGTANNYVQLSDGTNNVLYRIIGIVSEDNATLGLEKGQLKLLKDSFIAGAVKWHSSYITDIKWESSSIYASLHDSNLILGNSSVVPNGWSNKIDNVKWYIGDVNTYTLGNASTVFNLEKSNMTSSSSQVGLIYLSDYFYAYNSGGTTDCYNVKCDSWMSNYSQDMWTMTRFGNSSGNYNAWKTTTSALASVTFLTNQYVMRPVFYLTNDIKVNGGTGKSDDPFVLSY